MVCLCFMMQRQICLNWSLCSVQVLDEVFVSFYGVVVKTCTVASNLIIIFKT